MSTELRQQLDHLGSIAKDFSAEAWFNAALTILCRHDAEWRDVACGLEGRTTQPRCQWVGVNEKCGHSGSAFYGDCCPASQCFFYRGGK